MFADFARPRVPRDAPVELPLPREHLLKREWAVVCEGQKFAVCLAGWEPPGERAHPRRFEVIWSVEPEVVREASRTCCAFAATKHPAVAERARARLEAPIATPAQSQLRLASSVSARMLAHLSRRLGADAG